MEKSGGEMWWRSVVESSFVISPLMVVGQLLTPASREHRWKTHFENVHILKIYLLPFVKDKCLSLVTNTQCGWNSWGGVVGGMVGVRKDKRVLYIPPDSLNLKQLLKIPE